MHDVEDRRQLLERKQLQTDAWVASGGLRHPDRRLGASLRAARLTFQITDAFGVGVDLLQPLFPCSFQL